MTNFRKNEKSFNLFTASILLIVFMVVASIAVNVLTETQSSRSPPREGLIISSVIFSGGNTISVIVNNSGAVDFAITEVWINNEKQAFVINPPIEKVSFNRNVCVSVAYSYSKGTTYNIRIVSDRQNTYLASATAL